MDADVDLFLNAINTSGNMARPNAVPCIWNTTIRLWPGVLRPQISEARDAVVDSTPLCGSPSQSE